MRHGGLGSAIARQSKTDELALETQVSAEVSRTATMARELAALSLIAFAGFLLLGLICLDTGRHPNLGGPIGADLAGYLHNALGLQSYAVPFLLVWLAQQAWAGANSKSLLRQSAGGAVLLISLSAGVGLVSGDVAVSGTLGKGVAQLVEAWLNIGGGYIAVFVAVMFALSIMLKRAPTEIFAGAANALPIGTRGDSSAEPPAVPSFVGNLQALPREFPAGESELASLPRIAEPSRREKVDIAPAKPRSKGAWKLPAVALLDEPPLEHAQPDERLLERSARVLEHKLADFGIEGRVVEVQPGPVVTMYKFEPGSGIKVSQIVNRADDLSMALRALAVRILAPVPGEAVVGIEVPNRRREKVFLREILEAEEFQAPQSQLTIALGKDITGRPVAADLARMPHLLIAGATGTGKSVSIHAMIASILFDATADDVRFILIDPKMLELSVYEGIPHLLVPVVVDPEKAAASLLWATQEMERRYLLLRDLGARNVDGYNRAVASGRPIVELKQASLVTEGMLPLGMEPLERLEHRRLPKIVIVIDELADLLLSEGKTVERDIMRLAQKARAAGIHLILATQRPSVDVITGLIKANLPARISFQVTSRVDSRTILDSIGAERLLGEGDMLFLPPGSAKLRRLHGPFVSEQEIRRLVEFLRAQGSPEYRMEILETRPASDLGEEDSYEQDEMYDEAVRIVTETGQASISMIQRRLRVGYNRAARMVEQMERSGLVAPADGLRPREVRLLRTAR